VKPSELERYVDFVLKMAVKKCGNFYEAQELCQETMLTALQYISNGKEINNIRPWLSAVLNRKFYDTLRKKYKLPTVNIENACEIAAEDEADTVLLCEESAGLRKQIAFLAHIYREVIVRHYFNGENVESIAKSLKIPAGTVKSRLSGGRTQIKKGFDEMENYSKNSYEPQVLYVSISGTPGLNNEPYCFTDNNLIAQNLLILAYNKPVTETELAKAIGIPAAYIEAIIGTLVRMELMKRIGNKVYTDFIIYSHKDTEHGIEPQVRLINNNFDAFWKPLQTGLNKLRNASFYARLSVRKQQKLEYYFLMHTLSQGIFGAGGKVYDRKHDFPERPNGGKWIGSGHSYPQNHCHDSDGSKQYNWSGERTNEIDNTLGTKKLTLKVFDTPLEKHRYFHTPSNTKDDVLAQMLYIINEENDPSATGIDLLYFKNIPYFAECGILHIENGKPSVDIPILTKEEYNELRQITKEVTAEFIPSIHNLLSTHLKGAKAKLPSHLTGVPEQKQYLHAMGCLHMAVIYRAIEENLIFTGIKHPCPPMVLIVDK